MFSRLIGNEGVKETLRRLLANGRVPNALLFAGIDGIGKKQFALDLAKSFLCNAPKNMEACGTCPPCTRADRFVMPKPDDRDAHKKIIFSEHADVGMVVPYNRNILVDAIRELEKEAYFRPFEAAARFFIIDDADKMNDSASNALLKTLEEPALTSHIILISSRPDSLLQTIRSRCQTIRFAPVETDRICGFLRNDKSFSDENANLAANLSAGSIGQALDTDVEKFRERRDSMLRVLQNLLARTDRAALLQSSEEMTDAKNKDNYETSLEILLTLIRDVWTLGLGGVEDKIVNSDLAPHLKKLAENEQTNMLSVWITEIELLRETFVVNINRKIATDALFMRMAAN